MCDNLDSVFDRIWQASAHSILISTPDILAKSNLGDRWWNPPDTGKDPARYQQAYQEYKMKRQEMNDQIFNNRYDTLKNGDYFERLGDQSREDIYQLRQLNLNEPSDLDKLDAIGDQLSDIARQLPDKTAQLLDPRSSQANKI